MTDDSYYHSVANAFAGGTITLSEVGPLAKAMGQGWAAYNKKIIPVVDERGVTHHITQKRYRVLCHANGRIAADDTSTTLRDIARTLSISPQTVSNALRQFMAWGMLGYLSSRGKYGGLTLFARRKGDGLDRFARMAREAIREFWGRKVAAFSRKSNVQSPSSGVGSTSKQPTVTYSVDIRFEREQARLERSKLLGEALGVDPTRRSGYVACPAHGEHRKKTLSYRWADGILLLKCHAGCTYDDIRKAVA